MTKQINLKINGNPVTVEQGTTILDAAKKVGVKIPTLCYHPDLTSWAACGICIVKAENSPKTFRACATPVEEGMSIVTHDAEIVEIRKTVLELILSNHPSDCLQCLRSGNCELQQMAVDLGLRNVPYKRSMSATAQDNSSPSIVFNPQKCILCGRCVKVCQDLQNVYALEFIGRGHRIQATTPAELPLNDTACVKCGQCAAHCPVGAIYENKTATVKVEAALQDPEKFTLVHFAPSVRVAIGEIFGCRPGELTTGKLYAALRRLGFDAVLDTNFSADMTIMEEATEFVERFTQQSKLPLFTSCCPAWVDYAEKNHPEILPHLSTAKSPQAMFGSIAKTYFPEQKKLNPAKLFVVSVMPCTAKKYELERSAEMWSSGYQDNDCSITTRELGEMLKAAGVDFANLPEEQGDALMSDYTGGGTIFGVTGGVMEAALRTGYNFITGADLGDVNFKDVRGLDGVKEAAVDIQGNKINLAIVHGLGNVEKVLTKINEAKAKGEAMPYHFVEVMACRGGCIGGGGQPYGTTDAVRQARSKGLYNDDERSVRRCSHQNPEIQKLYKDFLSQPLSKKSHHLLHTSYTARSLYNR
ncbi:MAG: [FeFe] hydrogenase, group A [Candidatus Margulisbacteria bacterium]|jgi:NADH-quinone oxidoreductase subunit G|nr:[FeFe] hydrogenase, group A [Candidatus Margulisiibacteriota bacterium]